MKSICFWLTLSNLSLLTTAMSCAPPQTPPAKDESGEIRPMKIAIIGAGMAGASAAYHLKDRSYAPVEIHMYEASSQVGGKIKSIPVPGSSKPQQRIDIGAFEFPAGKSHFQELIDEAGLRRKVRDSSRPQVPIGLWNGSGIEIRDRAEALPPMPWKLWFRLYWRYGLCITGVRAWLADLIKPNPYATKCRDAFNMGYWRGPLIVSFAGHHSDLPGVVGPLVDGRFGSASSIGGHDILNQGGPLDFPHGTTVSLVERLNRIADVRLHLNSPVTSIRKTPGSKKYIVVFEDATAGPKEQQVCLYADYDFILVAAPLHRAGIEFDIDRDVAIPSPEDFSSRHVTLFASASSLSPSYFNLPADAPVPPVIYSRTASETEQPLFYSIKRSFIPTGRKGEGCLVDIENLYRVYSKNPLSDAAILALLGRMDAFSLDEGGVSWVHREEWQDAILESNSRGEADHFRIADRIHYIGRGDLRVDSLDNSCYAGEWVTPRILYRGEHEIEP